MDGGVDDDACGHEFLYGMCRGMGGKDEDEDSYNDERRGDDLRQACEDLGQREESILYYEGHKYVSIIQGS